MTTVYNNKNSQLEKVKKIKEGVNCAGNDPFKTVICAPLDAQISSLEGWLGDDMTKKIIEIEKTMFPTFPKKLMKTPNPKRFYKLSGKTHINKVEFYPSKIGSGHESYYKSSKGAQLLIFSK